ncbi:MAG: hypothetical protein AB2792_03905 [Candidatus Thiodiazotropha sp.]
MSMEERFKVISLKPNDPSSIVNLFQMCLLKRGLGYSLPRFVPLDNTIQEILSLGAKCALWQSNVQDPDFSAEHEAYYSKWTTQVARYCTRLHFFKYDPPSDVPLEVIDAMAEQVDSYLGFVTLRPISMSPVAATILKPAQKSTKSYLLCKDIFTVNIAGRSFEVEGTPFMQQDNAVGACAQASIWMALRTMRRKEGQAAFSPAQITTAATRFLVMRRTLPNRGGLSLEQVSEAIRGAGYAPHTIPLRTLDEVATDDVIEKMKRSLYPYIESGIPVLLILIPKDEDGHAVLLIGHSWNVNPSKYCSVKKFTGWKEGDEVEIIDASSWVDPLIIHNDNTGPYMELPDNVNQGYCLSQAAFAAPLLHPDIFIDGNEAQEASLRLLEDSLIKFAEQIGQDDLGKIICSKLVVRTFLQDRSEFRASVLRSDFPEDIKRYYRLKWLPKRIWISELNVFDNYVNAPESYLTRVGEVLLDPAAEAEDGAFLSIRLSQCLIPDNNFGIKGIIIDRDGLTGDIEASPVSGDIYSPLVRGHVG